MLAKYSYIKFHKNPSSETELFHADGNRRADIRYGTKSRFSQLHERA